MESLCQISTSGYCICVMSQRLKWKGKILYFNVLTNLRLCNHLYITLSTSWANCQVVQVCVCMCSYCTLPEGQSSPPFPFIASDMRGGRCVCVCWMEAACAKWPTSTNMAARWCKCVARCLPLPHPTLTPPSSGQRGYDARREKRGAG